MNFGSGMYGGYGGYQPQYGIAQPQLAQQQIVKVSGENGAKAYQMGPNSSALLLDETAPIVWLKTTDGAGYPSLAPYDIAPHQMEPVPNWNQLSRRVERLEGIVNESYIRDDAGKTAEQSNE